MTRLGHVIRGLSAVYEASIDADEEIARRNPSAARAFGGVVFEPDSLATLIAELLAIEHEHAAHARRWRRLMLASLVGSGVALALSLLNLLRAFWLSAPPGVPLG